MITIKRDIVEQYPNSLQVLALVDALTNVKSGSSTKSILNKAFGGTINGMVWNNRENFLDKETYLFYIKGYDYIAIPEDLYVHAAMFDAENAYLKFSSENQCEYDKEESLVWKLNYVKQNPLLVANYVLKIKGRKDNWNIKTEVLEILEGCVKRVYSRYEKIIENYVCLKVKFIE